MDRTQEWGSKEVWLLAPPIERHMSHRPCTTSKCQLASGDLGMVGHGVDFIHTTSKCQLTSGTTNSAESTGHAPLLLLNDHQTDHCELHQIFNFRRDHLECLIRFKVVQYPIKHFIVVPIQHQFSSFLWVFRQDGILQISKDWGKVWISMLSCLQGAVPVL